jgi:hypothetical protein
VAKQLTADQVQAKKDKAVQFLRDVVSDDDRADEIEDEDLDSYAERKHIQIINPRRNTTMANGNGRTKQDLVGEIADLRDENQALQDQLDAISDILAGPEDEDDDDQDDGDNQD